MTLQSDNTIAHRASNHRPPRRARIDVVLVRTRLQALIVRELIKRGIVSRDYILVRLYWMGKDEDHVSVNALYDELSDGARRTVDIFTGHGVATNVRRLLGVALPAFRTGGILFSASLIFLPFAIVLLALPGLRFRSLDDGRANVLPSSSYFARHAKEKPSLAGRVERLISPDGPAAYLRSRSERHYTIYPRLQNVVDDARLELVSIDWELLLQQEDLVNIPANAGSLLLGTVVADMADQDMVRSAIHRIRNAVDLHITHPRESDADALIGGIALHSPAESVIFHLSRQRPIVVYHFCSSAVIPFADDANVTSVDLLDDQAAA
jgi:hypothetical protein